MFGGGGEGGVDLRRFLALFGVGGNGNSQPSGKQFYGGDKIAVGLGFENKSQRIAVCSAAKAVVKVFGRRHGK